VGGLVCFLSAPTRHTATTRGLACKAAGQTRAKIWRGLSYVVRVAEFGMVPEGGILDFRPNFRPAVSLEWRGSSRLRLSGT
jgi:hypothetical protein